MEFVLCSVYSDAEFWTPRSGCSLNMGTVLTNVPERMFPNNLGLDNKKLTPVTEQRRERGRTLDLVGGVSGKDHEENKGE